MREQLIALSTILVYIDNSIEIVQGGHRMKVMNAPNPNGAAI
jgi:hypothetical protein